MWDVVIAGAGPAGLALAIELRRLGDVAVAVVDSARPRRMRLGETLSPDARLVLAHLGPGAFAEAEHAPCQGSIAVWGSETPLFSDFLLHPHGRGWRLDRERFDARLAERAAQCGVHLLAGELESPAREEGRWRIGTSTARLLVDATGRVASIARFLGARRCAADALVGIAGVFDGAHGEGEAWSCIEARCDGWGYSAVLPDGRVAVVAMTDSDLAHTARLHEAEAWRAWIEALPNTAARIAGATLTEGPRVASSASHRLEPIAGDDWLAVGDAATAFDPLSSQGIAKALRSGIAAAGAVHAWLGGDSSALAGYAEESGAEYAAYLGARVRYYGMEKRWPDAPFWRRRL